VIRDSCALEDLDPNMLFMLGATVVKGKGSATLVIDVRVEIVLSPGRVDCCLVSLLDLESVAKERLRIDEKAELSLPLPCSLSELGAMVSDCINGNEAGSSFHLKNIYQSACVVCGAVI